MKSEKYILIPVLIVVLVLLNSCAEKTDWNRFSLQGKVKSYMEKQYEAKIESGNWVAGDMREYGHSRVLFNSDGTYEWMEFMDIDSTNFQKLISKKKNGGITEEFRYNKSGDLIGTSKLTEESASRLTFVSFDENGKKTSEGFVIINNGKPISQTIEFYSEYNEKNKQITVVYIYNDKGHISIQKQTDETGEITFYDRYEYLEFDKSNNWTKRLDYKGENSETPEKVVTRVYEYY